MTRLVLLDHVCVTVKVLERLKAEIPGERGELQEPGIT